MNDTLGCTFRDEITGFEGVATGYCENITGCNTVFLMPRVAPNNKKEEGCWFDEHRLKKLHNYSRVCIGNLKVAGGQDPPPLE